MNQRPVMMNAQGPCPRNPSSSAMGNQNEMIRTNQPSSTKCPIILCPESILEFQHSNASFDANGGVTNVVQATLSMYNPPESKTHLTYKLTSNRKHGYITKPFMGVLSPGDQQKILVTMTDRGRNEVCQRYKEFKLKEMATSFNDPAVKSGSENELRVREWCKDKLRIEAHKISSSMALLFSEYFGRDEHGTKISEEDRLGGLKVIWNEIKQGSRRSNLEGQLDSIVLKLFHEFDESSPAACFAPHAASAPASETGTFYRAKRSTKEGKRKEMKHSAAKNNERENSQKAPNRFSMVDIGQENQESMERRPSDSTFFSCLADELMDLDASNKNFIDHSNHSKGKVMDSVMGPRDQPQRTNNAISKSVNIPSERHYSAPITSLFDIKPQSISMRELTSTEFKLPSKSDMKISTRERQQRNDMVVPTKGGTYDRVASKSMNIPSNHRHTAKNSFVNAPSASKSNNKDTRSKTTRTKEMTSKSMNIPSDRRYSAPLASLFNEKFFSRSMNDISPNYDCDEPLKAEMRDSTGEGLKIIPTIQCHSDANPFVNAPTGSKANKSPDNKNVESGGLYVEFSSGRRRSDMGSGEQGKRAEQRLRQEANSNTSAEKNVQRTWSDSFRLNFLRRASKTDGIPQTIEVTEGKHCQKNRNEQRERNEHRSACRRQMAKQELQNQQWQVTQTMDRDHGEFGIKGRGRTSKNQSSTHIKDTRRSKSSDGIRESFFSHHNNADMVRPDDQLQSTSQKRSSSSAPVRSKSQDPLLRASNRHANRKGFNESFQSAKTVQHKNTVHKNTKPLKSNRDRASFNVQQLRQQYKESSFNSSLDFSTSNKSIDVLIQSANESNTDDSERTNEMVPKMDALLISRKGRVDKNPKIKSILKMKLVEPNQPKQRSMVNPADMYSSNYSKHMLFADLMKRSKSDDHLAGVPSVGY